MLIICDIGRRVTMKNNYKRFDVVLVNFGTDVIGSEQGYTRPAVIIQNDNGNMVSPCTIVIPFSSHLKKLNQPTHTLVKRGKPKGLKKDSVLLGECIRQISEERIVQYLGCITDEFEKSEVRRVYLANFGE